MAYLKANAAALEKHTGMPLMEIRSALVTDYLVPMQFSVSARSFVDRVTDLGLLHEAFPVPQSRSTTSMNSLSLSGGSTHRGK
jgi:hypothetical protein